MDLNLVFLLYKLQSYPVLKILDTDLSVSNIADVKSVGDAVRLVWNQTWPIFKPPYLSSTILLCVVAFSMFAVGQAFEVWYGVILFLYLYLL